MQLSLMLLTHGNRHRSLYYGLLEVVWASKFYSSSYLKLPTLCNTMLGELFAMYDETVVDSS